MRRRYTVTVAGIVLVGAAGGVGWAVARGSEAQSDPGQHIPTGTAEVRRTNVIQQSLVNGVLGHADSYSLQAGAAGVVTSLPAPGSVVRRGQTAYEIDGKRVPLFYGKRPPWRALQSGVSKGADVQQLETNLKALGFGSGMTVDQSFTSATSTAIRRWQKATHLPVTGTVPLGQVVYAAGPMLIGGVDTKDGALIQPGETVEHGTGTERAVIVQLQPSVVPNVHIGDPVTVTLPDGSTRKGHITDVGAVTTGADSGSSGSSGSSGDTAAGGSQPVAPVTVKLEGNINGLLDQTPVQIAITSESKKNVLAVPIVALLARPGGTYEVNVVNGAAQQRVPVQPGLFDESAGLVEVAGSGLNAGQLVEVPSDGS
jgi:peptidoglycan hydrolase-like protein with peptidoglycan-binding domain